MALDITSTQPGKAPSASPTAGSVKIGPEELPHSSVKSPATKWYIHVPPCWSDCDATNLASSSGSSAKCSM